MRYYELTDLGWVCGWCMDNLKMEPCSREIKSARNVKESIQKDTPIERT